MSVLRVSREYVKVKMVFFRLFGGSFFGHFLIIFWSFFWRSFFVRKLENIFHFAKWSCLGRGFTALAQFHDEHRHEARPDELSTDPTTSGGWWGLRGSSPSSPLTTFVTSRRSSLARRKIFFSLFSLLGPFGGVGGYWEGRWPESHFEGFLEGFWRVSFWEVFFELYRDLVLGSPLFWSKKGSKMTKTRLNTHKIDVYNTQIFSTFYIGILVLKNRVFFDFPI